MRIITVAVTSGVNFMYRTLFVPPFESGKMGTFNLLIPKFLYIDVQRLKIEIKILALDWLKGGFMRAKHDKLRVNHRVVIKGL